MRIVATADLHYEWREEARDLVRALAAEVCRSQADVLAIAGDTFAFDPAILEECLALFRDFHGVKMLVAGNHDLWVPAQGDSSTRVLDEVMPEVCRRFGFEYLEHAPMVIGSVGFVGTVGWYDYSLRDADLDVPDRFYEHKTGPGYAEAKRAWRHLVEPPYPEPTADQRRIVTQWMDVRHMRLGMSDAAFTALLAARLRDSLAAIRDDVDEIVAVLHHLPFREALTSKKGPSWRFGNAFMGAEVFGEILAAEPKVRLAIYGHSHTEGVVTHGDVIGVNCGSTYRRKQYVVVDTADWSIEYRVPAP